MKYEDLEPFIDDDLAVQLTAGIFTGKSCRTARIYKRMAAAAACLLILSAIAGHSTLTTAARNLAVFLFGGQVTEEEKSGYYVLGQAAIFGINGEYSVDLAFRDGADVYAVISRNSAAGMGPVTLTAGDTVYQDTDRGSNCHTVTEGTRPADGSAPAVLRERSEMQCHFTGVADTNQMMFTVDGQSVKVTLEAPERSAVSQDMILKTNQMSWIIWPLAPDNSVVGVSNMEDYRGADPAEIFPAGSVYTADLLNPVFKGADGAVYPAKPVGESSNVWKAAEPVAEPVAAFTTEGIVWKLKGGENGLFSYTFQAPARDSVMAVNETLTAGRLELELKEIRRSAEDHITLVFRPMTNFGALWSGRITGKGSQSYGCSSGDDFTLSLGYTYSIMEPDGQTVKETVYNFPYETGEEMTVTITGLELCTADPASLTLVP